MFGIFLKYGFPVKFFSATLGPIVLSEFIAQEGCLET